jgi:hypothetical protein
MSSPFGGENSGGMSAVDEAIQRPFSFCGGNIEKKSRSVGEDHALACECSADYFEKRGRPRLAREQRQRAAWWRALATLPDVEADLLQDQLFLRGVETVDALCALAEKHQTPSDYLMLLSNSVLSRLLERAACGQTHAARAFMASAGTAINNFEFLANRKPQLFREWARQSAAIPGLISRSKAQAQDNDRLLKNLQQGEDSYLAPSLKHRRGQFWKYSNSNVLALRLISHVGKARASYEIDKNLAKHIGRDLPMWRKQAAELEPFSALTWKTWANVIWQVIAEISPQKKPGLNQAFHDPKTKISKVRKTRKNPYYDKEDNAFSVAEQDIKETLFGALELIGTGESQRTRQRKAKRDKK